MNGFTNGIMIDAVMIRQEFHVVQLSQSNLDLVVIDRRTVLISLPVAENKLSMSFGFDDTLTYPWRILHRATPINLKEKINKKKSFTEKFTKRAKRSLGKVKG